MFGGRKSVRKAHRKSHRKAHRKSAHKSRRSHRGGACSPVQQGDLCYTY